MSIIITESVDWNNCNSIPMEELQTKLKSEMKRLVGVWPHLNETKDNRSNNYTQQLKS